MDIYWRGWRVRWTTSSFPSHIPYPVPFLFIKVNSHSLYCSWFENTHNFILRTILFSKLYFSLSLPSSSHIRSHFKGPSKGLSIGTSSLRAPHFAPHHFVARSPQLRADARSRGSLFSRIRSHFVRPFPRYFLLKISSISFDILTMVNSDNPTLALKSEQEIFPPIFTK